MSKSAIKILTTAEKLFNENSFTSVGVDLIRDESGCSKTTMYTYFKNKQQLVIDVLKQRDLRFRHSLIESVADAQGIDALEKIYDWHILWFQQDHFKGCLFVRAVGESDTKDLEIIKISQTHKHWVREFIKTKACNLKHSTDISLFFELQLEGLINRFLVDGFDKQTAKNTQQLTFNMIKQLQQT